MDFLWILVAFLCGFVVKQAGMPPLVGYLAAGFALHASGVQPADSLEVLANMGITLMLFTIGLKLNIKALLKPEVWATSITHTGLWIGFLLGILALAAWLGLSRYFDVSLQAQILIGFALSFSSTVCVVKMLEEASELKTRHGKIALGVLIIQDIVAVIFLAVSTGKMPSQWALVLLGLWLVKPVLGMILNRVGHAELLPLSGFFLALGGAELFHLVDLKGDLGALLFGILLASHKKSSELYKALMGFKDVFLIGFFLSIGFTALPTFDMALTGALLMALLVVKFLLFFFLLLVFKVSGRAAYLTALALTNFSEFGLIVAHLSVQQSWMSEDWLVIIALVMSVSFILSTFIYRKAHHYYAIYKDLINRFELKGAHQQIETPVGAEVLILGMGRVGKGAYLTLKPDYGDKVWGIESDPERAAKLKQEGMSVVFGDADDMEFWQQVPLNDIRLVMLALPSQQEILSTMDMLGLAGYAGKVAAVARYEDEYRELLDMGIDVVFNFYSEAGSGFAAESRHLLLADE